MINCPEDLKVLYKTDYLPYRDTPVSKDLNLYFAGVTVPITQMVDDSFSLDESICSQDNIKFGACESSILKIKVANVDDDIKGREFSIIQTVKSSYTMPLGLFTVDSCPKEDNLIFKDIVAYDRMKKVDTDVADWYNGLFPTGTETYTLAQFRALFLARIGLEEDTSRLPLPNDSMTVEKTLDTTSISGRTVIEACEELNGCFGHINRQGKFTHIILKPMHGDYPQMDYPQMDYPMLEPYDEHVYDYQTIHFEEYTVNPIDGLQIRQEENDVGCIYGTGTNMYIIQGNFLVYGKSAAELEVIAANAAGNIFGRGYRPYEATLPGLSYVEVGDFLKFIADDTTAGYVLSRTLTGIQALTDEFSASGKEEQTQSFGVNNEIIQLQGKAMTLKMSVDGLGIVISDLAESTQSQIAATASAISAEVSRATTAEGELDGKIELTAESITAEVSRATATEGTLDGKITVQADRVSSEVTRATTAEGQLSNTITQTAGALSVEITRATNAEGTLSTNITANTNSISAEVTRATSAEGTLNSSISLLADQINLKVNANGVIAAINLSPESIKLSAAKIQFEGLVTANSNFKILADGSIEAVNGKFSGTITGSSFSTTGLYLAGNTIRLTTSNGKITDSNGNTLLYASSNGTLSLGEASSSLSSIYGYASSINMYGDSSVNLYASGTTTRLELGSTSTLLGASMASGTATVRGYNLLLYCANQIYLQKGSGSQVSLFDLLYSPVLYQDGSTANGLKLDASGNLIKNGIATASLGTSSNAFNYLYVTNIYQVSSAGYLGFFGTSPTTRKTVSKLSTSADLSAVITKVNALLDALGNSTGTGYGLIAL